MKTPIVIESLRGLPVSQRRIELVERKGIGHPDTICDSLVEAVAIGLNRMYLKHLGAVAHYNVDKALLMAGQSRVWFGGGEVKRSAQFIVGDRATFAIGHDRLPIEETVHNAADEWLARNLPRFRPHLVTRPTLAPGSATSRPPSNRQSRRRWTACPSSAPAWGAATTRCADDWMKAGS